MLICGSPLFSALSALSVHSVLKPTCQFAEDLDENHSPTAEELVSC